MPNDIVRMVEGRTVTTETFDIHGAAQPDRDRHRAADRPAALPDRPARLQGFVGPCYGGERNGVPVIRYEHAETARVLSQ